MKSTFAAIALCIGTAALPGCNQQPAPYEWGTVFPNDRVPIVAPVDSLSSFMGHWTLIQKGFDQSIRLTVDGEPDAPRLYRPLAFQENYGLIRRDRLVSGHTGPFRTIDSVAVFPNEELALDEASYATAKLGGKIQLVPVQITKQVIYQYASQ